MTTTEMPAGTTFLCGQHRKLSVPVLYDGEPRIRHVGDKDWCPSQRFTERVVREVDRETVLAQLTGEGES